MSLEKDYPGLVLTILFPMILMQTLTDEYSVLHGCVGGGVGGMVAFGIWTLIAGKSLRTRIIVCILSLASLIFLLYFVVRD